MVKFDAAKAQLQTAALWEQLSHPQSIKDNEAKDLGLAYFNQKISCPFLIDNACSIHLNRPIACREYLVTSDAKFCENPQDGKIEGVEIPQRISSVLGVILEDNPSFVSKWLPLTVAPYWQAMHPDLPSKKTGPEWIELFLKKLKSQAQSEK